MADILTFPTLPTMPTLGSIGSAATSAAVAVKTAVESPIQKAVVSTFFSSSTICILLGLLLIAAGLFSFDKTRELIVSGAKTGAEVAKAAA